MLPTAVARFDGARDKKQVWRPPYSNRRSFGSKCTVLKKVLATFLGLFGTPQRFGARGVAPSLPVLGTSLMLTQLAHFHSSYKALLSVDKCLLVQSHSLLTMACGP